MGYKTQILVVGGGLGGVAAALAATDHGFQVILTEETDWLGGQISSQAVPADEHMWIEESGRTRRYAELRRRIRDYYRRAFPLSTSAHANQHLNPGMGFVSKLCHLPEIGARVIEEMLMPAIVSGKLLVLYNRVPKSVSLSEGRIQAVEMLDTQEGTGIWIEADYVLDATELGDLLPLAKVGYVTGAESCRDTGELHAVSGDPEPENVQAFTWCFPMGYDAAATALRDEYAIPKPKQYEYWRSFTPKMEPAWSGSLLSLRYCHPPTCEPIEFPLFASEEKPNGWNLWGYRRILSKEVFSEPDQWHEITLINWPQNDYLEGNLIGASSQETERILEGARQLSLSFAYWLQNEAPRPDGGAGYHGLYLRPDITGTKDGLAKAPYIRESRRISALTTVTENHVGAHARDWNWPDAMKDSVGVGWYPIDLHPSSDGKNYIDIPTLPFQIPLGALIPQDDINLIAAAKNIGTTHITNGCYRLHPTEWTIGEAAGCLASFCLTHDVVPKQVWEKSGLLSDFQTNLVDHGFELEWSSRHQREYYEAIKA